MPDFFIISSTVLFFKQKTFTNFDSLIHPHVWEKTPNFFRFTMSRALKLSSIKAAKIIPKSLSLVLSVIFGL